MSKTVVLGVTGSIAAYKAAEIVSRLKKRDIDVRVILTKAGEQFITPLTLETLSHAPVVVDMFHRDAPWEVEHIALAKRADVFLIAPASADFIAKAAHGVADDMLTTTLLATKAPVLVAPAMNSAMYENPAVRENIEILKRRGFMFIDPDEGLLACGDTGSGRLAEPSDIVERTMRALYPKRDFEGVRALVSAGPTQEKIDPVRYLTNRSSGKMGYAIAEALTERGASVTLVSGPTGLAAPSGVDRVDVRSSQEMFRAIDGLFEECDLLIMAAAPADYTIAQPKDHKIKKSGSATLSLELSPTRDILGAMGEKKEKRMLVGFAAETEELAKNAREKLARKNLDMIFANDVSGTDTGFGVSTNSLTLYLPDGSELNSGLMQKREVADWMLDQIAKRR
ncbi:MAG: bifunctional phosphopantothenoylcysteine decarboxylase/phosphopantothenate--cysteine ligase CoaBC [Bacillota bacterium]